MNKAKAGDARSNVVELQGRDFWNSHIATWIVFLLAHSGAKLPPKKDQQNDEHSQYQAFDSLR
jgi:hypothetical protein